MIKRTLEQRIARLEKFLMNEDKDPSDMTPSERNAWAKSQFNQMKADYRAYKATRTPNNVIEDAVENWFWDHASDLSRKELRYLSRYADDITVDLCCEDIGVDETGADGKRDFVVKKLAELAKEEL